MQYPIRINKYLRDKDFCSRREADKIIDEGCVFINNKTAQKGDLVYQEDHVTVKDYHKENIYLAYYKPRGLPTQDHPEKESVVTQWREQGIYPVGRLDKESEGLLFLTNDGRFAREVLSDKKEWEKEYLVTVREKINPDLLKVFADGMRSKTFGKLLPAKTQIINDNQIMITLREGKRHQIRVMLDEIRYTVVSLKRVRIGSVTLGDMSPGETRKIRWKK